MEVNTVAVTDIRVEVIAKGRRVGAFLDRDLDKLEQNTVRPVFKCQLTAEHQRSLGSNITHVWVDAAQMGTDSGSVALAMAHVAQRRLELGQGKAQELEKLLGAILAIVGSDSDQGPGPTKTGNEEQDTKGQMPTRHTSRPGSGVTSPESLAASP